MNKDVVLMMFWINYLISDFSMFVATGSLMYAVYFNIDNRCTIEQYLYDLSQFCFDHDCSFYQLLQNEMGKVFQVTGALNAMAALFYDTQPKEDDHSLHFDMYSQVGTNVGKIMRYTLAFDPKEIHWDV